MNYRVVFCLFVCLLIKYKRSTEGLISASVSVATNVSVSPLSCCVCTEATKPDPVPGLSVQTVASVVLAVTAEAGDDLQSNWSSGHHVSCARECFQDTQRHYISHRPDESSLNTTKTTPSIGLRGTGVGRQCF